MKHIIIIAALSLTFLSNASFAEEQREMDHSKMPGMDMKDADKKDMPMRSMDMKDMHMKCMGMMAMDAKGEFSHRNLHPHSRHVARRLVVGKIDATFTFGWTQRLRADAGRSRQTKRAVDWQDSARPTASIFHARQPPTPTIGQIIAKEMRYDQNTSRGSTSASAYILRSLC